MITFLNKFMLQRISDYASTFLNNKKMLVITFSVHNNLCRKHIQSLFKNEGIHDFLSPIYIYKSCNLCLPACPIKTHEPLDRFASN